ncbi:MAG: T9SS type A sorting domain-containing protein, partial [Bacteroidales bacterium]|nr:T9SS type A sorting domain-containing protein [Bacteroidales bacterium]
VTGDMTFASGASVSEASISSYVNGKVTKNGMASSFCFPTGTASLYAPFEATSSSASNVSVQYASGHADMPNWWNHSGNFDAVGLSHASDRENWQVSASASTSLSGIKLYWNAGGDHSFEEGNDALSTYLRVAAVKSNGFNWQNLGQSSIDGNFDGAGYITAATPLAITVGAKAAGDGDYFVTFASTDKGNLLLPIELLSFTATCNNKSALVEWSTASERNNDYFVIERSDDAMNFSEVGRVAGAGNSIEPLDYSYTDYGIHGGDNYYRLVQVDYDGTRTVSEIVVANCIESEVDEPEVQAYPNPFNGELTLVLDNFDNRPATIEVYDMLGKLIYIQKADAPQNSYETILNLSNLPPAAYTVRVSTNDFVINKNVVKQ